MIDKIFFTEKEAEQVLLVRSGQYTEAAFLHGVVIEVQTYVEHRHDAAAKEEVTRAVGMPAKLFEIAEPGVLIVIDNEPVLFVFAYAFLVVSKKGQEAAEPLIFEKIAEHRAVLRGKRQSLYDP